MDRKRGPALGILLPIQRGETGFFSQGFDAQTQVKSNLINLMMTKKGERIMQPTFGCDIHDFVFDKITPNTLSEIQSTIEQAVMTWMPFVLIDEVGIDKEEDTNQVFVLITYGIRNNTFVSDSITIAI